MSIFGAPRRGRGLTPREADAILRGDEASAVPWRIVRWITQGLLVEGRRVMLAATKIGGRWRVRPEDLEAFVAALNAGRAASAPISVDRARAAMARRSARAERRRARRVREELEAFGLVDEAGDEGRRTRDGGKATA